MGKLEESLREKIEVGLEAVELLTAAQEKWADKSGYEAAAEKARGVEVALDRLREAVAKALPPEEQRDRAAVRLETSKLLMLRGASARFEDPYVDRSLIVRLRTKFDVGPDGKDGPGEVSAPASELLKALRSCPADADSPEAAHAVWDKLSRAFLPT